MPDDISYFRKQVSYLKDRIRQLQQQLEKSRILQDQNDELLRFERLLADLSSQFVNLSPDDAAARLEHGLELLALP